MGYYIETPDDFMQNKAEYIINEYNAKKLDGAPRHIDEVPLDHALICVVKNGLFDAAAYCYSERELEAFADPFDFRAKTWLLMDKEKAELESGYARAMAAREEWEIDA